MMSKAKVAPKPPTTKVPTAAVPDLTELLTAVESTCNRVADYALTASRALTGQEQGLRHDGVPEVFAAALEHGARQLEAVADRALRARTGGQS